MKFDGTFEPAKVSLAALIICLFISVFASPTIYFLCLCLYIMAIGIVATYLIQLTGLIEFRNVSFVYPTRPGAPVMANFNLVVQPGEMVALVGPRSVPP